MPVPDPASRPRRPLGAGGPFILILMLSIVIGFLLGQATMGFLAGAVLGVAVATAMWLRDRGR